MGRRMLGMLSRIDVTALETQKAGSQKKKTSL